MKTIKLFCKFSFTSLSPDAQPISVGIVSEDINFIPDQDNIIVSKTDKRKGRYYGKDVIKTVGTGWHYKETEDRWVPKSFYAEFSDFDLNRCDDWVKENVVSKLRTSPAYKVLHSDAEVKNATWGNNESVNCDGDTDFITEQLFVWISQFSDYQIQFVTDCGFMNWYHLLQLLAEWEEIRVDTDLCPECGYDNIARDGKWPFMVGLPILPTNISPVPEDLNDLIARVKGISVREAFDLNREELAYMKLDLYGTGKGYGKRDENTLKVEQVEDNKYNALFDARVIKEIYQKLK